jgi:hypothetical protein
MDEEAPRADRLQALQRTGDPVDVAQFLARELDLCACLPHEFTDARFGRVQIVLDIDGDFVEALLLVDREDGERIAVILEGHFHQRVEPFGHRLVGGEMDAGLAQFGSQLPARRRSLAIALSGFSP